MKRDVNPGPGNPTNHESSIALEGLEDLFKWASEMVADGEDVRVNRAKEQRLRRQVMEAVQRLREQEAVVRANHESTYLQKRLIAVLQKLQEFTEQNSTLKQIMVAQAFALERIPELEEEIKRLKSLELDIEASQLERRDLLTALSKVKVDCDYLDELLRVNEEENARLAEMLADTRTELAALRARKWWQFWKP
jgi:hypothetical protein